MRGSCVTRVQAAPCQVSRSVGFRPSSWSVPPTTAAGRCSLVTHEPPSVVPYNRGDSKPKKGTVLMARKVFFSFHYKADSWRTSQVRNIGAIEGNAPVADNDWESMTKG